MTGEASPLNNLVIDPTVANTINREAVRPYDEFAGQFLDAYQAIDPESAAEFLKPHNEDDFQLLEDKQLTLYRVLEIGDKAARASGEFTLEPHERRYLEAAQATLGAMRTTAELGVTVGDLHQFPPLVSKLGEERSAQAEAATDQDEKNRLLGEARELSEYTRILDEDEIDPDATINREEAANRFYGWHQGNIDATTERYIREDATLMSAQIRKDQYYAKYAAEVMSQTEKQPNLDAETAPKGKALPDEVIAAREHMSTLNVSTGTPTEQASTAPETARDKALKQKAADILKYALTPQEKSSIEQEVRNVAPLTQREGRAGGPATQRYVELYAMLDKSDFHTDTPEDLPKLFALLGMHGESMQVAEKAASRMRQMIADEKGRLIVTGSVNFRRTPQTHELEHGPTAIFAGRPDSHVVPDWMKSL